MVTIREETSADTAAIRYVNEQAFEGKVEAGLVEKLRLRRAFILSLVAIHAHEVVGHILFSPVTIESEQSAFTAVGLGPMAVLPPHQRRGIGSQLVRRGLEKLRRANHDIVVVLGHPHYYPRFGFSPTRPNGIRCEFDVPEEVFMLLELRRGAIAGKTGTVKYQPEFGEE
ncbi:MAG: N-acetyltransferase [Dehalococcoidia bacterium]|jgi:putative acetyltransferase|nr:N-acetyltransferase [Dehalococcoidia bacterium]